MKKKYKKLEEESDLELLKEFSKIPSILSFKEMAFVVLLWFLYNYAHIALFWTIAGISVLCFIIIMLSIGKISKNGAIKEELVSRGFGGKK